MKKSTATKIPTTPGAMFEGDVCLGIISVEGVAYAIYQPPKVLSEHAPTVWNESLKTVKGAMSWCDGLGNTKAMARAGSQVAEWALDNKLYVPATDEQDLQYRLLKPGTAKNWCYARSGINLSAQPPTYPYTPDFPKQTKLKAFREGGPEAFALAFYWGSTQPAAYADYAWVQDFVDGDQHYHKSHKYHVRAVRRYKI